MRAVIVVTAAVMLLVFMACGNQDQKSTESQSAVSAPKVDLQAGKKHCSRIGIASP